MFALPFLALPNTARAADRWCLCYSDLQEVRKDKSDISNGSCEKTDTNTTCTQVEASVISNHPGVKGLKCNVAAYDDETRCQKALLDYRTKAAETGGSWLGFNVATTLLGQPMPACLFQDKLTPECRNIGIFIIFAIKIALFLFSIIGALALAFFVYGGFILVLSQGNPEKIKKGTDSMLAALIGLAIAFSAYILVRYASTMVGLEGTYKLF